MSENINGHSIHPDSPLLPVVKELDVTNTGPVPEDLNLNLSSPEIAVELPTEIDEAKFSLSSIGKSLNPVRAARAYGRFMKRTVREFGAPEVAGTITAVSAGYMAHKYGPEAGNAWITAGAGSLGENVGFYGTSFAQRFRKLRGDREVSYNRREAAAESGRYLIGTFALAEAVDTPSRPVAMWVVPKAFDSVGLGIGTAAGLLGGKILADHVYYGVAGHSSDAHHRRAEVRKAKKAEKIAKSLE